MSLQECGNLPISSCTGILIAKYKELKSKLGLHSIAPIMCVYYYSIQFCHYCNATKLHYMFLRNTRLVTCTLECCLCPVT